MLVVCVGLHSAMDARQFHHHPGSAPPMTPFVDVIDLCAGANSDDVIKQETTPMSVSPRGGVSPRERDARVSPRVDDTGAPPPAFLSYRLDGDDSGGSSVGSAVHAPAGFDSSDPDMAAVAAAAADLCFSDAVQLLQRTGSPSESDSLAPLSLRHVGGPRPSPGKCKVCGDEATGMYFGALVCVPCKVISLRTAVL